MTTPVILVLKNVGPISMLLPIFALVVRLFAFSAVDLGRLPYLVISNT